MPNSFQQFFATEDAMYADFYRAYYIMRISKHVFIKYYANRLTPKYPGDSDNADMFPRVRWKEFHEEYPDHFTWAEFAKIRAFYWNVEVKRETVRIWDLEEGI